VPHGGVGMNQKNTMTNNKYQGKNMLLAPNQMKVKLRL